MAWCSFRSPSAIHRATVHGETGGHSRGQQPLLKDWCVFPALNVSNLKLAVNNRLCTRAYIFAPLCHTHHIVVVLLGNVVVQ